MERIKMVYANIVVLPTVYPSADTRTGKREDTNTRFSPGRPPFAKRRRITMPASAC